MQRRAGVGSGTINQISKLLSRVALLNWELHRETARGIRSPASSRSPGTRLRLIVAYGRRVDSGFSGASGKFRAVFPSFGS